MNANVISPKVSVVVPIYNVDKYLEECLNSLVNQTFPDFEVIMVNDGSTDQSAEICLKYEKANNNFFYYSQSNSGLSASRNVGIRHARGEYIYFLDSDDYLAEDAIEVMYSTAKENDSDVTLISAYEFIDGTKNFTWSGYKFSGKYNGTYSGIELLRCLSRNGDTNPSCCLFIAKRSYITGANLFFYEGILNEDDQYHFILLFHAPKAMVINKPLYYRRYRAGSITTDPDYIRLCEGLVIAAEVCDRLLEEKGLQKDNELSLYIANFLKTAAQKITLAEKNDKTKKELIGRIRALSKEYGYCDSNAMKLFGISCSFYKLYSKIMKSL